MAVSMHIHTYILDNVVYGMNALEDGSLEYQYSGEQEASMYEVPIQSQLGHGRSTIRETEYVFNASSRTESNVYATLGPNREQVPMHYIVRCI